MPATPAWPPASTPRLFIDQVLNEGMTLPLDGAQANYLSNVMPDLFRHPQSRKRDTKPPSGRGNKPGVTLSCCELDCSTSEDQRAVCKRYGANFTPPDDTYKVGISGGALRGELPLHGLRHSPEAVRRVGLSGKENCRAILISSSRYICTTLQRIVLTSFHSWLCQRAGDF